MYSVYIIYSQKIDKYYIGFSSNVNERLAKHNRNSKGFSNKGKPWILIYQETFSNKTDAMAREHQLKNWKNRERLETLIKAGSEHPDFQSGLLNGPAKPTLIRNVHCIPIFL
jgi:putative endonuclease